MASPKLSTQAQESTLSLIAPGIEAFKQQCMTGLIEIESCRGVLSVPAYASPVTSADIEAYSMIPNQLSACIVVSRLRTSEGNPLFNGRERQMLVARALIPGIGAKTLDSIRCEIQLAFGEIAERLAKAILSETDFDNDEDAAAYGSSEEMASDLNSREDEPDIDLRGKEPVPATVGSYDEDNVQHTPSQARAEGNSEPLGS